MVDTDDTRRTIHDGRRTTPRVWHKLPTSELKTRTRTRLLPQNLEMLMKIVIEGPAIEDMDFQSACKIWGDSVARRLLNTF